MLSNVARLIDEIEWQNYPGQYQDSSEEVIRILHGLSGVTSEDDLNMHLYGELTSHLQYGSDIFEIAEPVVKVFNQLCEEDFHFAPALLDFLGYIYRYDIRERLPMIVYPIRYGVTPLAYKPSSGFNTFQSLFTKHFYRTEIHERIYSDFFYTPLLHPTQEDIPRIFGLLESHQNDTRYWKNGLISAGLINQICGTSIMPTGRIASMIRSHVPLNSYLSVFEGLSGLTIQVSTLLPLLNPNMDHELSWSQGYSAVLAVDALLLGSQNNPFECGNNLQVALTHLDEAKAAFQQNDYDFPLYPYMAEDLTSIVFRNLLHTTRYTTLEELTTIQKELLLQLHDRGIHTHAMLKAGLLPKGITPDRLPTLISIYDYSI